LDCPKTAIKKFVGLLSSFFSISYLKVKQKFFLLGKAKNETEFQNRTGGEPHSGQPRGARERAERTRIQAENSMGGSASHPRNVV